jgi:hypothetical protein
VVAEVDLSSTSAELGHEVSISDTTRNRGARAAGTSQTRYYLSHDDVRDSGDFALPGSRSVPRLPAGDAHPGTVDVEVPMSAPIGSHFVLACADGGRRVDEANERNNCRRSSEPIELTAPPSSAELIDEAEADAAITHDEAVMYKVFADFGDPRLPAAFEVAGSSPGAGDALDLARDEWASLSQETRNALDPFFLPAFYAASWANLEASPKRAIATARRAATIHPGQGVCAATQEISDVWGLVKTENRKVTIWYQESYAGARTKAVQIAEAIDGTIWPKLTGLFRRPLADAGGSGPNCQGPDRSVDLVLAPQLDARGVATEIGGCQAGSTPGYVQVLRSLSGKQLLATTAHELMHVIGFAYPSVQGCSSYELAWLHEATGKWSEDYVYPKANLEHAYAKHLINFPGLPLETYNDDLHQYGAYLFPFYLSRRYSPELVAASWGHLDQSRPLGAIDQALEDNGGSFNDEWHEFARYNWNRSPVDKYKRWDGLRDSPMPADAQSVFSAGSYDWTLDPVDHLAAAYNLYEFGRPSSVGHVEFTNPYADTAYTRVQAIVELADGTREVQDWSEREEVRFCRENPAEEIAFLTLIVSHSDWGFASKSSDGTIGATARKECFPKEWTGTASGTVSHDGLTETFSSTYTMDRTFGDSFSAYYGPLDSEGPLEWSMEGTNSSGCSFTGEATIDGAAALSLYSDESLSSYGIEVGRANLFEFVSITRDCPTSDPDQIPFIPLNCACVESYSQPYEPGASQLSGSREYTETTDGGDIEVNWNWDLTAGSDPPAPRQ